MVAKTREQARRETLEMLRSRPRQVDTPFLTAYFAYQPETLAVAATRFLSLASQLIATNRYVERWTQIRTPAEQIANSGLDIIANPDEFDEYLRSSGNDDQFFNISTTAASEAIPKPDPSYYTAIASYTGGPNNPTGNQLSFAGVNHSDPLDHTLNLQEWINVIDAVVAWRNPLYLSVGSPNYPIYDAVFDHRAWGGWIGWFPVRIDPKSLPNFAITKDIGFGTLVATQDANVITSDPAQVERAKEVEIALAQLGVLPTLGELR